MSSTRLTVLRAVLALVTGALPGVEVLGLTTEAAKPGRIGSGGRAVLREGDPGDPEIDLSPLAYNYTHAIPIELDALRSATKEPPEIIDDMLKAIGAAVAANRTLGGLCHFIDAALPSVDDTNAEGARSGSATTLIITAQYTTANPLN
jgi:hypothetical protein